MSEEDGESMRKQVTLLTHKLAQALAERDDLARDVESLCMETTANTTFSSSSVLRERIFAAEKDVSRTKAELLEATGERDGLREDLRAVKEAKRQADQTFREQAARVEALERELGFYRQQAAAAIADRDRTVWDCEQLRQTNAELAAQAKEADRKAEAAAVERSTAERRLEEAQATISGLHEAAAAAEALPALRSDLSRATARSEELQQQIESLEGVLRSEKATREQSEARRAEAEAARDAAGASAAASIAAAEAAAAAQKEELSDVARQKVEALMRLSQAEAARSAADREVGRLQAELTSTQEQLGQATAEKVQALLRVADLRAVADGAEGLRSPGKGTPLSSPSKPVASTASWFSSPSKG